MARFPVDGVTKPVEPHWGSDRGAADIFANRGTPVRSVEPGIVQDAGYSAIGGYNVTIKHASGRTGYYAHLDGPPDVGAGQTVDAGTKIGGVGDTGNARGTGPHLHFGFGWGIQSGTGPTGGSGKGFDVTSWLNGLLGEPDDDPHKSPGSDPAKTPLGQAPSETPVDNGPPLSAQPFSGNVIRIISEAGPLGVPVPTGIALHDDAVNAIENVKDTAGNWVKRRLVPGIFGALIAFIGGYLVGRGDAGARLLGLELIVVGVSIVWFAYRDTTLVAWEAIRP